MLKAYLNIIKPGIIFGNLIAVIGGYLLATRGSFDLFNFICTLLGVTLVIASGCVFNNVIDRDIDPLMKRTQQRAVVQGDISVFSALVYGLILGLSGFGLLFIYVSPLVGFLAVAGFFVYVVLYSLYFKRHSVHGTFVGSFSGAVPPVMGYCAVTLEFDISAILLLAMFSVWQMPHSFAIAINRFDDYQQAKIPVLPHVKGILYSAKQMFIYAILFLIFSVALGLIEEQRIVFTIVAFLMGSYWCILIYRLIQSSSAPQISQNQDDNAITIFTINDVQRQLARKIFFYSIILITSLSIAMAIPF